MVHSSSASIDGQEKTDHYSLSVDANRVPFVRIDTFVNLLQNVERVEVGVNACLIACIINLNHWWEVSRIHVIACSSRQPIKLPVLNSYVFSETERLILMIFLTCWKNVISVCEKVCAVKFVQLIFFFFITLAHFQWVAGDWIYTTKVVFLFNLIWLRIGQPLLRAPILLSWGQHLNTVFYMLCWQFPSQIAACLRDPILQHLMAYAGDKVVTARFTFWLQHALTEGTSCIAVR